MNSNVKEKVSAADMSGDSSSMEVRTREAEGIIAEKEEFVFLNYGFRTSKYNTFIEKINVSELSVNAIKELSPYIFDLKATIYGDELFDDFELNGTTGVKPLVKKYAVLNATPWYKSYVEPIVYQNYPLEGIGIISWRDITLTGVPPTGDIKFDQRNNNIQLTSQELESGIASQPIDKTHYYYGLPYYWARDYYDIRMELANKYPTSSHSNPQIAAILKKVIWPVVDQGDYPVAFEYVLPGINKVTSSKTVTFKNPYHLEQPSL